MPAGAPVTATGPDPLVATAARLRALVPGAPDLYTVELSPPDGPGWWPIDAVPVARWCADARAEHHLGNPGRLASVAATSVGGGLAHAVLARVTAALALDSRAWDVAALVVHRAPWGHVDRVALSSIPGRRPTAWVVAGDPALGPRSPAGVRVFPDEPALLAAVAAAAVRTLDPLLAQVRAATRFGRVPLWNAAADAVRVTAATAPLYAGRPARPALAAALLDALVAHGAAVRGRGVEQPLPGRPDRVPVRAACCLAFRTDPPVARPGDALCTTCPLLPPPERARRYGAFLDGIAGIR